MIQTVSNSMPLVAAILAVAALLWWAAYAQRGNLWLGLGAFVTFGYVLGPPLWTLKAGPVPLTFDRLLLLALVGAFLWQWRAGKLVRTSLTAADWLLIAALAYFTLRVAATPAPPLDGTTVKPWWRFIAAFCVPAALYLIARTAPLSEKSWRGLLWTLAALGAYLCFTAFAEINQEWWAIFPRYIADPDLGTHFGRARGPALNSASLGVMLTVCFWAAWFLWPRLTRPLQLAALGLLAAIAAAIYFTYTRSTWIGLALTLAVIPLLHAPRSWRPAIGAAVLCAGVLGAVLFGSRVINLDRHDTDESAEHSVYQRASFFYVSMRMWEDAPVFGCGFGRFYDLKLAYLADRSQQLELESIRELDHHNTLLSILVETGAVGFALFMGLLAVWMHAAWRLASDQSRQPYERAHGLFALAVIMNYLSSALFHDLTLMPAEHWLIFLTAGGATHLLATKKSVAPARSIATPNSPDLASSGPGLQAKSPLRPTTPPMIHSTEPAPTVIRLFGMTINALTMHQTVGTVLQWCRQPRGAACRYVVTPDADHAVMYQTNAKLRDAYAAASLVLADGAPIAIAAKLLGRPLPERVPGSDLAPALFKATSKGDEPLRVFLLGAAPGVAERAAANITARWRHVQIVGTLSPPLGFERSPDENERIFAAIAEGKPDLLVIGLGAPKQELWTQEHAHRLEAKVALCVGATIDFLAGEKRRAPRWMRRVGLEWLHRLASEPGRLAKRYAHDAWVFPQLIWRDWRGC